MSERTPYGDPYGDEEERRREAARRDRMGSAPPEPPYGRPSHGAPSTGQSGSYPSQPQPGYGRPTGQQPPPPSPGQPGTYQGPGQSGAYPPPGQAGYPGQAPPDNTPAEPPAKRRGPRSLFWPGFALGFLLLSIVTCGGLGAAIGLNRSLAAIQGAPEWTPPPIPPTPEVAAEPEGAIGEAPGPGATFYAGQQVRNATNSRVNVRRTPGYQGKSSDDVVAQLQPNDVLEVLGESAAADNLMWWSVRFTDAAGQPQQGWVAEATASGVQILVPANQ